MNIQSPTKLNNTDKELSPEVVEESSKKLDKESPKKKLDESIEKESIKDETSKFHKITESEYNPTSKNYHPIKDAFWDHSQP